MNLANKITFIRVFMIPLYIGLYSVLPKESPWPLMVFALASATDAVDGYIARSRNLVTVFGQFLDPLADKLLVLSAFILFNGQGLIPSWTLAAIVAREIIITGFRVIAASESVNIAASSLGKIKTITQMLAILLIMFEGLTNSFSQTLAQWGLGSKVFYLAVFFTVLSGIDYIVKNLRVLDLDNI